jgi:hypothetical protein
MKVETANKLQKNLMFLFLQFQKHNDSQISDQTK